MEYVRLSGAFGTIDEMASLEPGRAEYWRGFSRGIARAHGRQRGVADAEHALWMRLADDPDPALAERGRGYRDGLAAPDW